MRMPVNVDPLESLNALKQLLITSWGIPEGSIAQDGKWFVEEYGRWKEFRTVSETEQNALASILILKRAVRVAGNTCHSSNPEAE